jgi:RHS repeat-associated protein
MGCPRIDTGNFLPLLKVAYKRLPIVEKSGQGGTKGGVNFCVSSTNYKFGSKELQETGAYDFGARQYLPDIARWVVPDPLSEKHPDLNPMMYANNNPVRFVDPDGMDWVESKNGDVTWRDDVTAKNHKDKGVLQKGETYRGTYYERTKTWDNSKAKGLVLETYHTYGKMSYSEQVGLEINVTGDASATGRKDKIGRDAYFAEGTMQVKALFDNGKSAVLQTVDVNSGPWDYGPTPNGEYSASGIVDTNESGMVRDGVGFKVLLNNNTALNRTGLRIHPDQNPSLGTAGCIGICENAKGLKDFRNVVRDYFNKTTAPFKVNINFRNNPNYNRPSGGKATSGQ